MAMSVLDFFVHNCHNNLIHGKSDNVKNALGYLSKRNISNESIILHQLGYCLSETTIPNEIRFYGKELKEHTFSKGFDFFIKNRLVVPIFNEFNIVVGFATRKPTFEPGNTWWNLSKPFKKGNHLFLLNKARKYIFEQNKVYVVEGYIDALILYQYGIKNVCALMGTKLTPRKIGLIARYCNNICLCLDVDENKSGQKGQDKAILALSEFGFCDYISVIDHLDIGEDPADYVMRNGIQDFIDGERILKSHEIEKICKSIRNKK